MRTKWAFTRRGTFLGYREVKSSYTTIKVMVIYTVIILSLIGLGVMVGSLNVSRTPTPELFK